MRKFNSLLTDSYVKEETESADKEGHLEIKKIYIYAIDSKRLKKNVSMMKREIGGINITK